MAFIPFNLTMQVNINQRLLTEPAQNTLYFTSDSAISTFSCQAFADLFLELWIDTFIPLQSSDVTLFSVEVFSLEVQEGPYGLAAPSTPTPGGLSVPSEPGNVSVSCAFKTSLRGRSHRGRNYWVGIPTTEKTGNFIDTGYLADILAAYGSLMGYGTVYEETRWVVASRYHNNEPRAEGLTIPITAVEFVDNVVDSMRNRLPSHNS